MAVLIGKLLDFRANSVIFSQNLHFSYIIIFLYLNVWIPL